MIRTGRHLWIAAAGLLLAACASAPLHYYTLVAPADESAETATPPSPSFELLPVGVPAQVDQPQLVVREGGQGVALLGSERWIAPLGDEVRSADVSGLPGNGKPLLRIKLDVRRFDSAPGSYALIESAWSVRLLHGTRPAALACSSRISEAVGPGYPALVQGHQRAIARLAAQIATAARALGDGQSPACPPG